jgi:hypothetical protein
MVSSLRSYWHLALSARQKICSATDDWSCTACMLGKLKNMKLNDSLSGRSMKLTNCGLIFLTFLKRKKTPSCRSLPEDSKRITITTLKTWKVGWKTIVDDELQRNFSLN